jgi:phosphoribosylglycinamide formyltransferase 1
VGPADREGDRPGARGVIGVLVSGEGTNLQALLDAGLHVLAVASNEPGAPALDRAHAAGLPNAVFALHEFDSREQRDLAMANWLERGGVELVVCAGYMHLLTPAFLDRFPGRIVNVHPSLLPRFPGTHPIEDALAAGAAETGVTVHVVDDGVDTGPILAQERVAIAPDESAEHLRTRLHEIEHRLLPRVVRELTE